MICREVFLEMSGTSEVWEYLEAINIFWIDRVHVIWTRLMYESSRVISAYILFTAVA